MALEQTIEAEGSRFLHPGDEKIDGGDPPASSPPRNVRHEITDQPSFAKALILPGKRGKAGSISLEDQDWFVTSSTATAADFLEARIRASSLVSTAVAVTPSGDTVTTK
jgi:hypothetical protein